VTREILLQMHVGTALRLLVVVLVGVAAYVLGSIWRSPEVISEVRSLRGRKAGWEVTATR
jgi:hypothetical protein